MFPVAFSLLRNLRERPGNREQGDEFISCWPWIRSSNEEPGGHLSSCVGTWGFAAAWKYNTSPMSEHLVAFEVDTERFIKLSCLFLFVFSCAKAVMGPRFLLAECYLKLMQWGAKYTHVNVHPNKSSHNNGRTKKHRYILGFTTSRWVVTSVPLKSKAKQFLFCSEKVVTAVKHAS